MQLVVNSTGRVYCEISAVDYLAVDRSAMSNELGKMRDEGILSFQKNHIELREAPQL